MEPESRIKLHSSNSSPSFRASSNHPNSIHSAASKGGLRRHGLLKSDTTQDQLTKDLPIPPILTPGPSEKTGENVTMMDISVPRKHSENNLITPVQGTSTIDEDRLTGVACPDPTVQRSSTHANIHRPSSVTGADVGDDVATACDSSKTTSSSRVSSIDLSDAILTGRAHRILTGGDLCEGGAHISDYIHITQIPSLKVRPVVGLEFGDENHEGHPVISKVQSPIHHNETPAQPALTVDIAEEPFAFEHLHHGHNLTPKVRPSFEHASFQSSVYPINSHEGHIDVQKVRPFYEPSPLAFQTEENSTPRTPAEKQTEEKESPKVTSYWGFLPRFGERRDKDATTVNEFRDQPITQANHEEIKRSSSKSGDISLTLSHGETRPSFSASQYSASQKSLDVASKTTKITESSTNQENVRHGRESTTSLGKALNTSPRFSLQGNEKGSEISSSAVSPTSQPHLVKSDSDQPEHGALPESIDPRHAATWLRQFLGYPELNNSNLTQLPEKSHPRHQDHDDYPIDNDNATASRVTTFSGENAAEAGAMATAMHNLEQLLSEALVLANEVTEQDSCGHADNENIRSYLQSVSEVVHGLPNPESAHDIVAKRSSEYANTPVFTRTPPNIFVGAVEGVAHGCEALPSSPTKRPRLTKPGMRSGNIRRPRKRSSFRGVRKSQRKPKAGRQRRLPVSEDDEVLPMPPPDNQLKRQDLSPMPHAYDEDDHMGIIKPHTKDVPNSREVREYIRVFHQPPITPRQSSRTLREASREGELHSHHSGTDLKLHLKEDIYSLGAGTSDDVVDFSTQYNERQGAGLLGSRESPQSRDRNTTAIKPRASQRQAPTHEVRGISLRRRSHVSLRDGQRFSLTRSVKRHPTIARDWSPVRKRFVASIACISTALIGVLVGIYAGLVPSIQYYIADFHHYSILGNVGLYLGMALSTFFCWPLPLLHGRKTYIVCSLCIAMPLLFPQAIAISTPRSPYTSVWRWALLLPRAIMGCALGFASMNFHSILTDLYGASLMSSKPHQEVVDYHDVRRHGGGLGVWLGIWTWCFIGSLGIGFLVGALVIDSLKPSWGLYISIILIAVVLFLNAVCPEVRRSAWRYSAAEVRAGTRVSRRVGRGEIMMHRVKDGPKWWYQEMYHGVALSLEMLRQPGFVVMAVYSAWIYAQVVLIIVVSY